MTNLRERLNLLILELVAKGKISRVEAVARIRRALGDVAAKPQAVGEGNAEGAASDPEPNPDVFEEDER